ncbi:MAG: TonB family protein [Nitratireductor sp.]|nr:TonB family protein [Nitratireductor sp.]
MRMLPMARVALAIGISMAIHGAVFARFSPLPQTTQVAGGAMAEIAAIGNSFEEMVAAGGKLQPVERFEVDKSVEPVRDIAKAVEPRDRTTARPVNASPSPEVLPDKPVTPLMPTASIAVEETGVAPSVVASLDASMTQSTDPSRRIDPVLPEKMAPVPQRRPVTAVEPRETKPDETPAETGKVEAEHVRPVETASLEKPLPEKVVKKPKQVSSQGPGTGKSRQDAIKGSSDGTTKARSAKKGNDKRSASAPGNAAASNYPGLVYSKIRRTRQRRAGGSGVVRVRFSIRADGQLGSVAVARGSGTGRVDKTALEHVRRAAPFPPPPPGARTRFVIPIEVRG